MQDSKKFLCFYRKYMFSKFNIFKEFLDSLISKKLKLLNEKETK